MRASTEFTFGITSSPSTRIGELVRLRSATCSAARFSVRLIFSPLNIALMRAGSPASRASAISPCSEVSVMRFLE
ncbi:hypothetical protein D3C84_1184560 [compost metagenome]